MDYGFKVTTHGRKLLAACIDLKEGLTLTRVLVGCGHIDENTNLADMHELIQYVAEGKVTKRRRSGDRFHITVQYSNKDHPDIGPFSLAEFIIYANDPETGEETDLLYATFGDYASVIPEYHTDSDIPPGIWTFPLILAVSEEMKVSIEIPGGLVTYDDLLEELEEKQDAVTSVGLLKGDGKGGIVSAVAGVDYGLPFPTAEPDTPLENLVGVIGQHYYDKKTGKEYVCTGQDSEGNYIWKVVGSGQYYRVFEPEDWTVDNGLAVLRIPQEQHGLEVEHPICPYTLRQRVDRTALDYLEQTAAQGRTAITNAVTAALNANSSAPGTYPTAEDGHVQLTWSQVQCYILEGTLLAVEAAASKASEKGFNWQDRDTTGAPETATLDAVLTAAYLPALGGAATGLDNLCTAAVLQGLRLRRKATGVGTVTRYDLDGAMVANTWSVMESRTYWDLETKELVLEGSSPFAGELMVVG